MSDNVEKKVAEFIRLHGIFAGAGRILLAVSGGADSISLLHVLKTLQTEGTPPGGACLRPHQSPVAGTGERRRRAIRHRAGEQTGRARRHQGRGCSGVRRGRTSCPLETAGRQLRLAALDEIAREQGCSWIATGHQKNDNAETVIHRLRRGTGFRGLAGIRPIRQLREDLWLARPLLCVTRDEIVRYLREHDLPWREDHTNIDVAYTRNYIRHKLLPLLQQESGVSLIEELSDLAASAGRLYDRIHRQAEQAWAAMVQPGDNEIRIDASGLASLPEPVAIELIRRALVSLGCGERDLTEGHYRHILQLGPTTAGRERNLAAGRIRRSVRIRGGLS